MAGPQSQYVPTSRLGHTQVGWLAWADSAISVPEGDEPAAIMAAQFTRGADFRDAQFSDRADVEGARVAWGAGSLLSVCRQGGTTRWAKPEDGEDPAFLYLTEVEESPDA